jgi:hypothetical protein
MLTQEKVLKLRALGRQARDPKASQVERQLAASLLLQQLDPFLDLVERGVLQTSAKPEAK